MGTGFGSTNKDSTSSLIFVSVNLMALGIILKFTGFSIRDIPLLLSLSIFLVFFFATYRYFKKQSVKSNIISSVQNLKKASKISLYLFSLIYTILIPILFLRSYA